jgi:phosphoribosyl-ATP pyrophosphohydrolase
MFNILKDLVSQIKKNKNKSPKISYTSFLIHKKNFCLKKFLEEAKELEYESRYNNNKRKIIYEAADMLYHFFVLLEFKKVSIFSVLKELIKRRKISGIQEKNNRKKNVRSK